MAPSMGIQQRVLLSAENSALVPSAVPLSPPPGGRALLTLDLAHLLG